MRAEPRDLLAVEVGRLERVPCAVDQTACVMLPRSKRPVEKRVVAERRQRREAGGVGGDRRRRRRRAAAVASSPAALRAGRASAAEHLLARVRPVGREPARADPSRRGPARRAAAAPPPRGRRGRRAGRAARSRRRRAARAPPACRRSPAACRMRAPGNALFGITRLAFVARAEDPERAAGRVQLVRQALVLDPGHASRRSRGGARAARRAGRCRRSGTAGRARRAASRIVSSPCSGMSLPTNSGVGAGGASPAGTAAPPRRRSRPRRALAGARRDRRRNARALRCRRRRGPRAERAPVDARGERAAQRARAEAPAVGDERVPSETSGLKTTGVPRAARRGRAGRVPGVADEHRVEAVASAREQRAPRRRRARAPRRPAPTCLAGPPTPGRALDDLDAGPRRHEITCALRG